MLQLNKDKRTKEQLLTDARREINEAEEQNRKASMSAKFLLAASRGSGQTKAQLLAEAQENLADAHASNRAKEAELEKAEAALADERQSNAQKKAELAAERAKLMRTQQELGRKEADLADAHADLDAERESGAPPAKAGRRAEQPLRSFKALCGTQLSSTESPAMFM